MPSTLEAELVYFAKHGYDHTTYNHKLESLEDALNSAKDHGLSCQFQTVGGYVDTTQIQEIVYVNDIT